MVALPSIPEIFLFLAFFLAPEGCEEMTLMQSDLSTLQIERKIIDTQRIPSGFKEIDEPITFWEIDGSELVGHTPTRLLTGDSQHDFSELAEKLAQHDWSRSRSLALCKELTLFRVGENRFHLQIFRDEKVNVYTVSHVLPEGSRPVHELTITPDSLIFDGETIDEEAFLAWSQKALPSTIVVSFPIHAGSERFLEILPLLTSDDHHLEMRPHPTKR